MVKQHPLSLAQLQALAPQNIPLYRQNRYIGDDNSVVLNDFAASDRAIVQHMYATLLDLMAHMYQQREAGYDLRGLQAKLASLHWSELVHQLRHFGEASAHQPARYLPEAVHDIRGGSFAALAMNIQMVEIGLADQQDFLPIFFLLRDHLKIMRNTVRDIDPPTYVADWTQKLHSVQLIVEKWHNTIHKLSAAKARVEVDCHFDGNISERCLEFSALDRVLYNLINNAVRHSADEVVYLSIFPLLEDEVQNIRFVIYNAITPDHRQRVRERFGPDLNALFGSGFTTGGSGLGLSICRHFVANAYGIHTLEAVTREGHLGATLIDDYFVNWFHWPIAAD